MLTASLKYVRNILKNRLDVFLVENGYFSSREKAKSAIMAGLVFVDGQISDKAGNIISDDSKIEVKGNDCPYVSRGGFKLEKALNVFNINVKGFHCIDIGASTGGFTDCLLQHGAEKVYSVDVGYGQLDYKLRIDPRVVCMEKINFRYMQESDIPEKLDFACADVSFISLKHMFPVISKMLKKDGQIACLIKPQFESTKEQVGKNGIIHDPKIHKEVIENVIEYAQNNQLYPVALDYSPVTGAKGNIEFLLHLVNKEYISNINIDSIVKNAHKELI